MALSESQSAYRELLSKTAQEAQSDYDKAVLTLSGGALGISVAFVKDIVGAQAAHSWLLIASWVLWGISCASVLVSYYTSGIAFSKEIEDFDKNPAGDRAISVPDVITKLLNAVGGGLFLIGLLCFCWFAAINLSRPMNERADSRTPVEKVDEG